MLSDESRMRIFTGNANPDLAREIAENLGTTVGDAVINRFNNGEVQVMINESVRGKDIFIVQPTCGPIVNDNVMELLIMADAFKRASASHITAVIPSLTYRLTICPASRFWQSILKAKILRTSSLYHLTLAA